jgi:hypothetical protein
VAVLVVKIRIRKYKGILVIGSEKGEGSMVLSQEDHEDAGGFLFLI